jgi:hypothetical protein
MLTTVGPPNVSVVFTIAFGAETVTALAFVTAVMLEPPLTELITLPISDCVNATISLTGKFLVLGNLFVLGFGIDVPTSKSLDLGVPNGYMFILAMLYF